MGISFVTESIRQMYHITQLSMHLRQIIAQCIRCKELKPKPLSSPFAPYHWSRLGQQEKHAFQIVGLDLFGPYIVCIGKHTAKRYGAIFMCQVTRAIHLEVVHDMGSESFVLAMDRFVSRRGCPEVVICDNGSNFVGVSNEFHRLKKQGQDIVTTMAKKGVEFHFNPPGSPHWGGSYERAIRTIKQCLLDSIYGVVPLYEDVLQTALVQAESIMNRRPLGFDDEGIPLTPMQLISPMGSDSCSFHLPSSNSKYKLWRQVHQAVKSFWKRWRRLYLNNLSMKVVNRIGSYTKIVIGDRVLLKEIGVFGYWRSGIIRDVFVGIDNFPRAALVETSEGLLYREIHQLSMVETADHHQNSSEADKGEFVDVDIVV